MTTSNSKFRSSKEAPTEPFKRAVTSCLRAIARKPELEVTFAAERPGLAPGKARLPEPARKMTKRDAAIVRGHADSIALKLACHDPKVHRKLMPGNPQARGVFDAVEQARVEAIGARRMSGVAKNLTAMLDDHFHRGKFDEITDRADAPLSDALAMLVRERLTGLAPPAGPPPGWPGFRPLRVSRIERESGSVKSLVLSPADDRPLVAALPGQSIVLRLHPTAGGPAVLRNYSLSDFPVTDHYRVSIKQEVNGVASTYLHNQIRIGDLVEVAAPRGSFTLNSSDRPVVLLSAGVGATPVLAMLHALARENSPREIWWLFGARNREEHPFAEESRKLVKRLARGKSHVWYSRPGLQDRPSVDFDLPGRIGGDALKTLGLPLNADFYLCGPSAFLQDVASGLAALGVSPNQVHEEIFGAAEAITPGIAASSSALPHPPEGLAGSGPQVSFARSGLTVRWNPKFASLLEFAEACDVPVRWSCRTGVCHMCESGLISGQVAYEPEALEAPARGNLLICCSRPMDDVAIDL